MAHDGVTVAQPPRAPVGATSAALSLAQATRNYGAVRAISFDLDDTLWDFRLAVLRAEEELKMWLAQAAPGTVCVLASVEALPRYREQVVLQRPDLVHSPQLVRLESIRQVLLDAGGEPNLAAEAYAVFYRARQCAAVFDDAVPALDWLFRRYRLVAVTNGNSDLQASPLRPYFCGVLTAAKLGYGKPDQRIFRAAADAAGVPLEAVLHVGDDITLDVQGALAAGMQAAWMVRTHLPRPAQTLSSTTQSALRIGDLAELCDALEACSMSSAEES